MLNNCTNVQYALKVLGFIFMSLVIFSCQGKVVRLTSDEVHEQIQKGVPLGSSKSQVETFLDSFSINGIKAVRNEYHYGRPQSDNQLKIDPSRIKGYLIAGMQNVERDPSKLQVYNIHISFYFDQGDRLIDYKVEKLGDW